MATYLVSTESKAALQTYQGSKLAVGNVTVADGMSLGQFVAKGFNDGHAGRRPRRPR